MQKDPILEKIIQSTYTLTDLYKKIRILKKYLISKFFDPNQLGNQQTIDQDLNSELDWLKSLGDEFYSQFNSQNVYQMFEELERKVESISPLTIYLGFEPPKEEIANIGLWLRKNTKGNDIFDLKLDYGLIGGCALVKNGTYKDYSLKNKLKENTNQIGAIIRSSLTAKDNV